MTTLNDTANPAMALLRNRFAPWLMICDSGEDSDENSDSFDAEDGTAADFDVEDPRDLRVLDRLARLEAFSAA
jgi:hypothetical protein